ncbi:MAG: hypothetical protein FJ271_10300 [Planctomycetes bacterium]|nr:hypothetical protein [Planctomycetota bacterium]
MNQPPKPIWVRLVLLGASSRGSAVACCLISLILGVAIGLGGLWDRRLFPGFLLLVAALGYWGAIRWMDRHDSW